MSQILLSYCHNTIAGNLAVLYENSELIIEITREMWNERNRSEIFGDILKIPHRNPCRLHFNENFFNRRFPATAAFNNGSFKMNFFQL